VFEQVLPGNTKAVLATLEKSEIIQKVKKFGMVNVTDVRDIAAMKIAAIASRGTKRDFVDLYFICKENISLPDIIQLYDKKYENLATTETHIMKSLVYFEDAESDETPKMLKDAEWAEIKRYFEKEVRKLAKRNNG